MLALFAEPSGATFYLDIQEPLPFYHVPMYDNRNPAFLMPKPGAMMRPTLSAKTYKLVGLSYCAEPTIAFYDRELQW